MIQYDEISEVASHGGVGGAQAIRRAADILRTVGQIQSFGASLSRVAKATGLNRSTAHRILRSLAEEQLLDFDEQLRIYRIGPLAFELGLVSSPDERIGSNWHSAVSEVARQARLTSYLIVKSHDEAVCLFCAQGSTSIRAMPIEVGQRVPLGIGAGSLAILSSLPDGEIHAILAAHQERYKLYPGGAQDAGSIMERVMQTRARGYSLSQGTVAAGVLGLGVLVPPQGDAPRCAITVSAVAQTVDESGARTVAEMISGIIKAAQGRNPVALAGHRSTPRSKE